MSGPEPVSTVAPLEVNQFQVIVAVLTRVTTLVLAVGPFHAQAGLFRDRPEHRWPGCCSVPHLRPPAGRIALRPIVIGLVYVRQVLTRSQKSSGTRHRSTLSGDEDGGP